jgi:SAM-dependent methyltransferase
MTDKNDRAARFQRIFEENAWGNSESVSGEGSNLDRTRVVRAKLPALLARHKVRSILDAPCGDFYWMKEVALGDIDYIGADIVPEIIERDVQWYAGPKRRFVLCDLVSDPLPKADLILCRDCLVHLPYHETRKALENMKQSGATWLLTTTFTGPRENRDIELGDWRAINLERPPYNFPAPVDVINEESDEVDEELGAFPDKSLGLWRLADVLPNF